MTCGPPLVRRSYMCQPTALQPIWRSLAQAYLGYYYLKFWGTLQNTCHGKLAGPQSSTKAVVLYTLQYRTRHFALVCEALMGCDKYPRRTSAGQS